MTAQIIQASLKLVLERVFEGDFEPCSYGFRPRRRAQDAAAEIHHYATGGAARSRPVLELAGVVGLVSER